MSLKDKHLAKSMQNLPAGTSKMQNITLSSTASGKPNTLPVISSFSGSSNNYNFDEPGTSTC
jgi:hypothetical protein